MAPPSPYQNLPENLLRFLVESVAKALASLHDKGVCHCDVKLPNLLRFFDGSIKVIDFDQVLGGVNGRRRHLASESCPNYPVCFCDVYLNQARVFYDDECVLATTAEICPPEAAAALLSGRQHPASPAFDLWSLGCVIYHLIMGKPLLQKLAPDAWEAAQQIQRLEEAQRGLLNAVASTTAASVAAAIEPLRRVENSMMKRQAANLLARLLDVSADSRSMYSMRDVLGSPFLVGDYTPTMKERGFEGIRRDVGRLASKVERVAAAAVDLSKLPEQIRAGFDDLKLSLGELKQLTVGLAELTCPGTFVMGPEMSLELAVDLSPQGLSDKLGGFLSAIGSAFGDIPGSLGPLIEVGG